MPRILLTLVLIAITVYALADAIRTDTDKTKGVHKYVWIALIVLFPPIGGLAWLIAGKRTNWKRVHPRAHNHPSQGNHRSKQAPRFKAPDDDPEFLRKISETLGKPADKPAPKPTDKPAPKQHEEGESPSNDDDSPTTPKA